MVPWDGSIVMVEVVGYVSSFVVVTSMLLLVPMLVVGIMTPPSLADDVVGEMGGVSLTLVELIMKSENVALLDVLDSTGVEEGSNTIDEVDRTR